MTDGPDRPKQLGMSHLGLSVTDLDRSIAFYCDVLGGQLIRPPSAGFSPAFDGRMAIVLFGRQVVDLFEHAANEGERFGPARTGLDHLSFGAESLDDLEAWARWLDAHELPRSSIRETAGATLFDFTDPDGIQLEFACIDPAARMA